MKSHFSRGGNYFSTKLEGNCNLVINLFFFFKGRKEKEKCQSMKGKTLKRFLFFIFVPTLFPLCVCGAARLFYWLGLKLQPSHI